MNMKTFKIVGAVVAIGILTAFILPRGEETGTETSQIAQVGTNGVMWLQSWLLRARMEKHLSFQNCAVKWFYLISGLPGVDLAVEKIQMWLMLITNTARQNSRMPKDLRFTV